MDTNVVSNHENKLASDEPVLEAPRGTWRCCHSTAIDLGACPQALAGAHAGQGEHR